MGFTVQISVVGEAEYPLLQTLREAIFSEFGHTSRASIADSLADQQDLLVLMAHLEGNPVGFSAGYRRNTGFYYLNYLGVLSDYRRQGLGKSLLQQQVDNRSISRRRITIARLNSILSTIFRGCCGSALALDFSRSD